MNKLSVGLHYAPFVDHIGVFVDGVRQKYWEIADEAAGFCIVGKANPPGHVFAGEMYTIDNPFNGDIEVAREILRGTVEIRLNDDATPEAVADWNRARYSA